MRETGMHLFAYGTLMVPEIMARVAGCQSQGVAAVLQGAVRYGVRNEEYPGIVRCPGEQVEGVLYLNLSQAAIDRLDRFEGEYYCREEVEVVRSQDGKTVVAMAYIFKSEYQHLLTGSHWDYRLFFNKGRNVFEQEYWGYLALD